MEKFNHLGTLKEWLNREYSNYVIRILDEDLNDSNIPVYITTTEEVGIRIKCTKKLSQALRNGERTAEQLNENIIIKVSPTNNNPFYRISDVVYGDVIS
jgi:hypothetical protein